MLVFPGTELLQNPLIKQGTPETKVTLETVLPLDEKKNHVFFHRGDKMGWLLSRW